MSDLPAPATVEVATMKIHKRGEKSKALCGFCEGVRSTTLQARTVPFRHRERNIKIQASDVHAALAKHVAEKKEQLHDAETVLTPAAKE